MKKMSLLVTYSFFLAQSLIASVAEFKGAVKTVDISGKAVKVYSNLTLTTANGPTQLKLTGYGIRQKSIGFVKLNIYLATSYIDEETILSPSNPIDSLKNAKGRVIVLDLLRTLTAADIRTSFEEALDINAVDVNSKAIQSVFSKFTGDLKEGDRILLASYPGERSLETLVIELPKTTIQETANLLGLDFWKIWFGEPVDALMGELKSKLTGGSK